MTSAHCRQSTAGNTYKVPPPTAAQLATRERRSVTCCCAAGAGKTLRLLPGTEGGQQSVALISLGCDQLTW
eukprot:5771072-Pyramimonas_sp.AAC.1